MNNPASKSLSDAHCTQLQSLLRDLIDHADRSTQAADDHRKAIGSANPQRLAHCIARQQSLTAELSELEARRAALIKAIGLRTPIPLSTLATAAPPLHRAALSSLAAQARAHLAAAHRARESVALASSALLAHMQGLLQQIARELSQTKTYGPSRTAVTSATPSGSVDLLL